VRQGLRQLGGRIGQQQLPRLDPPQLFEQRARHATVRSGHLGRTQLARRRFEHRQPEGLPRPQCHQRELATGLDPPRITRQAGRHHLDDLALHQALARDLTRVLDLLADRHAITELRQALQVLVRGVHRDAAHRNWIRLRLVAGGERDVEQRRSDLGVLQEHLVEVPHPVEQDLVRVLRLDGEELTHHGRVER
jgi:hypothetical protein